MKIILSLLFILSFSTAMAQEYPDFEAELQALETNQLKTEELQMNNADAVTDVISDEVATGQAGLLKPVKSKKIAPKYEDEDMVMPVSNDRVRRIRSR